MTITKEERVARARASCDGKVDADDVLALLDALAAAEARAEAAERDKGVALTLAQCTEDAVAAERTAREKAERERDELRGVPYLPQRNANEMLAALEAVGMGRPGAKYGNTLWAMVMEARDALMMERERAEKAEAGAAVMREALEHVRRNVSGRQCALLDVVNAALATNAGKALLDELNALRDAGATALAACQANIAYASRKDEPALCRAIEALRVALSTGGKG